MKKITRDIWITDDGKEFETEEKAVHHNLILEAQERFDSMDGLVYGELYLADVKGLMKVLGDNKRWVLPLMGWKEDE